MGHFNHHHALAPDARSGDRLVEQLAQLGIKAEMLREPAVTQVLSGDAAPALLLLEAGTDPAYALAMLQRLALTTRVPSVVLGFRTPPDTVADLLEAGADDVLDCAQPLRVSLARVRAVLRRSEHRGTRPAEPAAVPAWRLAPERRQLLRPCGNEAALTTAEFDLFRLLSSATGQIVCRDTVALQVLRRRIDPTDRSVDNLVMRLRRKLGEPNAVKTVRGRGYMFAGFDPVPLRVI